MSDGRPAFTQAFHTLAASYVLLTAQYFPCPIFCSGHTSTRRLCFHSNLCFRRFPQKNVLARALQLHSACATLTCIKEEEKTKNSAAKKPLVTESSREHSGPSLSHVTT